MTTRAPNQPVTSPPGFAARLRLAMGARSTREFARACGIHRPSVIRLLRGDVVVPRLATIQVLAARTGVRWEWLASGEGLMRPLPEVPDAP